MDKEIRQYLAKIGEKGGRLSKRSLTPQEAKTMVKIREARRAFKNYYAQCFWSCNPNLKITGKDVYWVGQQIMKYGNQKAWNIGVRLCR